MYISIQQHFVNVHSCINVLILPYYILILFWCDSEGFIVEYMQEQAQPNVVYSIHCTYLMFWSNSEGFMIEQEQHQLVENTYTVYTYCFGVTEGFMVEQEQAPVSIEHVYSIHILFCCNSKGLMVSRNKHLLPVGSCDKGSSGPPR